MSCVNRGLNAMSYRLYKTHNEGGPWCTGNAGLSRRRHARSQRSYTRMLTDRSCINVRFTPQCGHHSLGTHAKRSSIQDENASYDPRCKQAEEAGRIVALAARSPFRAYPAPIFAIPGNHDSFVVPGTPDDQKPL